jgi:hypothetical protein
MLSRWFDLSFKGNEIGSALVFTAGSVSECQT